LATVEDFFSVTWSTLKHRLHEQKQCKNSEFLVCLISNEFVVN